MPFAVFITGTNTGVGKTFFSYLLCKGLKDLGYKVGYWKPIETGADPYPSDAKLLAALLGQSLEESVGITFKPPLAPAVAERYEGEKINLEALREKFLKRLKEVDILVVEGAGGLAVPIKGNYTYGNLARDWNLPTLIVSDAKLGTINCSFLTAFYGKSLGLDLLGFVFNRFTGKDLSEKDNPSVVENMTGLPIWFKVPETNLESYRLDERRLKELIEFLTKKEKKER
jgi:dethiobiotin synthetase